MLKSNKHFFIVLIFFSIPGLCLAQVNTQEKNIYSTLGIGELRAFGSLRNLGMGNTGLAVGQKQYLDFKNPALLSRNQIIRHVVVQGETVSTLSRTYGITEEEIREANKITDEVKEGQVIRIPVRKYTKFETALRGGLREIENQSNSYSDKFIGYQYLLLSVPVSPKLTLAAGLTPFSNVGFTSEKEESLSPTVVSRTFDSQEGGLNQAFAAAGYDINRNFSIGLQAGYIFGKIWNEHFVQAVEIHDSLGVRIFNRAGLITQTSYSGLSLKPGLAFNKRISRARGDSAVYFSAGITYDFFTGIFARSITSFQERNDLNKVLSDSVTGTITSNVNFPSRLSLGFAFSRTNRWVVALDGYYALWSEFSDIGSSNIGYANAFGASIGAEFSLNRNREISSIKKPVYRAGFSYNRLPYIINGEEIDDYSVSVGASFPVGKVNSTDKNQPLTKINLALISGLRGSSEVYPGREVYLKAYLGILISDKWFRRRRIQ